MRPAANTELSTPTSHIVERANGVAHGEISKIIEILYAIYLKIPVQPPPPQLPLNFSVSWSHLPYLELLVSPYSVREYISYLSNMLSRMHSRSVLGSLAVQDDSEQHWVQFWKSDKHLESMWILGMQELLYWAFQSSNSPCELAHQSHQYTVNGKILDNTQLPQILNLSNLFKYQCPWQSLQFIICLPHGDCIKILIWYNQNEPTCIRMKSSQIKLHSWMFEFHSFVIESSLSFIYRIYSWLSELFLSLKKHNKYKL